MRTLEYIFLTLLVSAAVIYGARAVASAVSNSFNQSAACIENPRTC